MTAQQFFTTYGPLALQSSRMYGLNAATILAVSSWETAYGTSYACKNDKNFFGIKSGAKSPHWDGVSKRATSDGGYYRQYANAQDSFYDFGWLITTISRYSGVKGLTNDPKAFAEAFIQTGYMGGTQTQRNNYRDAIISRAAAFSGMYASSSTAQTTTAPTDNTQTFMYVVVGFIILYYLINRYTKNA